jgi:predicted porin
MQKKLIVLAVSGALGVPLAAFAQATSTVYGRANLGIDQYRATGSSVTGGDMKSRFRVYDSGSRLGFRGTEDLGGGMQAYFVLESGVNWDTGTTTGQGGQANASSGTLATRDSFLGIKAAWGEVSWGRQSIFWANGLNAQSGANYINASADGILTGLQIIAPPVTRQSSVIYYTSPRMAGLDVAVAYSPQSQEPGGAGGYTGSGQAKPYIWGLGVKYRMAGLYVQLDHAVAKNNGFVAGRDNTGDKLGASYGYMPGSRVGVIVQRLQNKTIGAGTAGVTAAGDTLKNTMYGVNWEHTIGSLQLLAGFFMSGEIKGASLATNVKDTKTNAYHVGAKHYFSKRTGVYASYNVIANKPLAMADFTGGAYTSGPLTAANLGADPKVIAVGMMHNF